MPSSRKSATTARRAVPAGPKLQAGGSRPTAARGPVWRRPCVARGRDRNRRWLRGRRLVAPRPDPRAARADHPDLDRHDAGRSPARLRLHEGEDPRVRRTRPRRRASSSAPTPTRRRRCRRTQPCSRASCPSRTAFATTSGSRSAPDQPTLASLLRGSGYASGGFVSAFVLRKESGIGLGFDHFDDQLPPSAPDVPMGQVQRSGPDTLQAAERWMSGLASPKFFLFFHIYEPHTPYTPPERFSQYTPYNGEIAYSDEVVGRLRGVAEGQGLVRPRDNHPSVRSRRRARGSRRARARALRLRLDDPRAADREDARKCRRRAPRKGAGPAHRPGARPSSTGWASRPRRACEGGRSGR